MSENRLHRMAHIDHEFAPGQMAAAAVDALGPLEQGMMLIGAVAIGFVVVKALADLARVLRAHREIAEYRRRQLGR